MANILKKILTSFINIIPLRKTVLFESCPDLSDNTKPVFDEMVRRGINNKYKLIWFCYNDIKPLIESSARNIELLDVRTHRFKAFFLIHTSKMVIYCNRFIGCNRKGQIIYYLTHGIPLKNTSGYYFPPDDIDWMLTSSEIFTPIFSKYAKVRLDKCLAFGYPRNDIFKSDPRDLSIIFGGYSKYIIWYPTVKTFKSGRTTGSKYSIPLLYDLNNLELVNNYAKQLNVLIIIKPHFSQTLENHSNLSNVVFINDNVFLEKGMTSYELLASCDALLSDYSSVYYDYLLCDKQIGLIWEDIEDFKENPGLIDEYEKYCSGGEKIYNIEELCSFIKRVSRNIDLLKEERNRICDEVHASRSGDSSIRVVNHIMNYLNIKEEC